MTVDTLISFSPSKAYDSCNTSYFKVIMGLRNDIIHNIETRGNLFPNIIAAIILIIVIKGVLTVNITHPQDTSFWHEA